MELLRLLDTLLCGHPKISVLVLAHTRGDKVIEIIGEYVSYKKGEEVRTVHLGCFPPVTEDADAALRELGNTEDYFLGFDSASGNFYAAIPGRRIFASGPTAALAISKALVTKAIREKKQQPPIIATAAFEVDEEELLNGSESRIN